MRVNWVVAPGWARDRRILRDLASLRPTLALSIARQGLHNKASNRLMMLDLSGAFLPKEAPVAATPRPGDGARAAQLVRRLLGLGERPISMRECCRTLGLEFALADLHTDQGGCEALLIPLRSQRFRIVVDPKPRAGWGEGTPAQRQALARHRTRFRIAHEIAHTFFYRSTGSWPTRMFAPGSTEEESFADEFARSLLIPTTPRHRRAEDVFAAQRYWGVSLEVAARALADTSHPPRAITLWRWSSTEPMTVQWASGTELCAPLSLPPFAGADDLRDALLTARRTIDGLSAVIATERRQALAVLAN